jgi:hypothetical protein
VRPAFSNSSASGGWFFDDSCIVFERDRETMFTTNSPVYSTVLNVSLSGPPSGRGPTLMQSVGGLPSIRNDENQNRIVFRAILTQDGSKLQLAKFEP